MMMTDDTLSEELNLEQNTAGQDEIADIGLRQWDMALTAARLFAVDPFGLQGLCVRACPGPVREQWFAMLKAIMPKSQNFHHVPLNITDDRLLGGLDLSATLRQGRPIMEDGVLTQAAGGVLVLSMAERISAQTASKIVSVLDRTEKSYSFAMLAFDEGVEDDETLPSALQDRLTFQIDLNAVPYQLATATVDKDVAAEDQEHILYARSQLEKIEIPDELYQALCHAADMFGIVSMRAPLLAVKAARAAAALAQRTHIEDEDIVLASQLILAPRAVQLPQPPSETESSEAQDSEGDETFEQGEQSPPEDNEQVNDATTDHNPMDDIVLEATLAALPENVLERLRQQKMGRAVAAQAGRAQVLQTSQQRGRAVGIKKGSPKTGARLNLIETLKAAAPWQRIRSQQGVFNDQDNADVKVKVRADDFRVKRLKERTQTATIFVVDASGSTALNRLAEAKGAIELLLADCYKRRDQVAMIAFRGAGAEIILPPTRSLVRAKRGLSQLPGGGGTPLSAGIDAAVQLGLALGRKGMLPILVFLTDGGANITRDGRRGRAHAQEEALEAAKMIRSLGQTALLIDTSPRPQPRAEHLADAMGAQYLPLPMAGAQSVSNAVKAATTHIKI